MGKIKLRMPAMTREETVRAALDAYGRTPHFVYYIAHRVAATTPEDVAFGARIRAAVDLVVAALRWSMAGVTWHAMDVSTVPSAHAPEFAPLVRTALAEIGCSPCHVSYYGNKSFRASFHEADWRERVTLSITVCPGGHIQGSRQTWKGDKDSDWIYAPTPQEPSDG